MSDQASRPDSRRAICSPRIHQALDQARGNLRYGVGRLRPALIRRFRLADAEPAQQSMQDLGVGLCGRPGRRLSSMSQSGMTGVTCNDCRQLLAPLFLARPGVAVRRR